ncbi:MAG: hypothetical protein L0I76_23545, partial [Pseudonocardia sp.]|nr:hypothetical protein [Pseudonocardia sp.]
MEHFDEIVTDERLRRSVVEDHLAGLPGANPYLFDRYRACASGGPSGRRGVFVYDWDGWVTGYWSCLRHLFRAVRVFPALASAPRRPVMVAAAVPTHVTASLLQTFAGPQLPWRLAPVTLPLEQRVGMRGRGARHPVRPAGQPLVAPGRGHLDRRAGRRRRRPGGCAESQTSAHFAEVRAWGGRAGRGGGRGVTAGAGPPTG